MNLFRLLAARPPDAFRPELARSLVNVSVIFGQAARVEDAIGLVGEAVGAFRELVIAYPDAFFPYLAAALNNLINLTCDAGRPLDALVLAEEPVRIRRGLAASQPDSFLPELARSLAALAHCYELLDKREEATAHYHESLSILVPVAERLPHAHGAMAGTFGKAYLANVEEAKVDHRLISRIAAVLMKMDGVDTTK